MKTTFKLIDVGLFVLYFLIRSRSIAHPALAAPDADAVAGNGTPASCNEMNFNNALTPVQDSRTITLNWIR